MSTLTTISPAQFVLPAARSFPPQNAEPAELQRFSEVLAAPGPGAGPPPERTAEAAGPAGKSVVSGGKSLPPLVPLQAVLDLRAAIQQALSDASLPDGEVSAGSYEPAAGSIATLTDEGLIPTGRTTGLRVSGSVMPDRTDAASATDRHAESSDETAIEIDASAPMVQPPAVPALSEPIPAARDAAPGTMAAVPIAEASRAFTLSNRIHGGRTTALTPGAETGVATIAEESTDLSAPVGLLAGDESAAAEPAPNERFNLSAMPADARAPGMNSGSASAQSGIEQIGLNIGTAPRTAESPAALPAENNVRIQQPLTDPQWRAEFASRVQWLVGDGASDARILINPPELGPIDIRIKVQQDQTSIQFTVQHAAVREVVEDALPRLREMLQQSGLNLANADVSADPGQQQHLARQFDLPAWRDSRSWLADEAGDPDGLSPIAGRVIESSGLIDTFI